MLPWLVVLLYALTVRCELLGVQLISRHGTRAPNPVVKQLCPADIDNLKQYQQMGISLAGVTGAGMLELYVLGNYTRQRYIVDEGEKFVTRHYDSAHVYVQAVAEDRTIQSAVAWSQGLYPPHSGTPLHYVHNMPAPIPVYMLLDKHDNLLETRKALCKNRLAYDSEMYDNNVNAGVLAEHKELIDQLADICGVPSVETACNGTGDNVGDAIKDITDAMMFDYMSGFTPLPGLTFDLLRDFRRLAVNQLLGRIVGNEEQITYMNGALPQQLIANFDAAIDGGIKLTAYHAHRELLYSLAAFLDIQYDIPFPGMPRGAIPPATTLFIELHRDAQAELYVEFYLWTPCYPLRHHKLAPIEHDCTAKRVHMQSCGKHCTYKQFQGIIAEKIQRTGSYIELCTPYNTPQTASNQSAAQSQHNSEQVRSTTTRHTHHHTPHTANRTAVWPYAVGVLAAILAILAAIYLYTHTMARHDYQTINEPYPHVEA